MVRDPGPSSYQNSFSPRVHCGHKFSLKSLKGSFRCACIIYICSFQSNEKTLWIFHGFSECSNHQCLDLVEAMFGYFL